MADYTPFFRRNLHRLQPADPFLPLDNPTFGNPPFEEAIFRVLIARLSPLRDVDRSIPHSFLFHEVRQALPETFIDLAFFPSAGHRALFEAQAIPFLAGTQSHRSADDFDLVLISNAYTLELINLPALLIHSAIPLFASQRGPEWPPFILGGSNSMAAQAVIGEDADSLVDGLFFGEGEGLVGRLVSLLHAHQHLDRRTALRQAAGEVTGLWVSGAFDPVTKAVAPVEARLLPASYPILNTSEANTASLQITHGCPAFCAFCFEAYDRRPYREIPLADLLSVARQIKRALGVEKLNLYSFNFNTYGDIPALILALHRVFARVGMTSQRLDVLYHTGHLLEMEIVADKRSFTLGIEGISQRQRDWLHKSLAETDVEGLLRRLLRLRIRTVKLFYVLTGHETGEDIAAFRRFVKQLKHIRRAGGRGVRVIFSVGLLIRMPHTPLRYDRLRLEEEEWRLLVGQVKSACETNGFEFRLAFDWPEYAASQVLALGGYWLVEAIVDLAHRGYCYDTALPPEYWADLRRWMEQNGYWTETFLGEKGPDYPFPLDFVRSNVPQAFVYRQYQAAQAGRDEGMCLGTAGQPGRCLGCGACRDEEQRRSITHHRIDLSAARSTLDRLRDVMARKRHLEPVYFVLRLPPALAGTRPEFLNSFAFRGLLRHSPLVENLLSVRESLFTVGPNDGRYPGLGGETVFALTAWDAEALVDDLANLGDHAWAGTDLQVVGPVEGFTPGTFTRFHLDLALPARFFPRARSHLEQYLRGAYLPYSLRRAETGYRFDVPAKGMKKKILFGGFFVEAPDGLRAHLDVGPRFDLAAFLETFGQPGLYLQARAVASKICFPSP